MNQVKKTKFGWVVNKPSNSFNLQHAKRVGYREQLEWIKRQIEYANFTDKFQTRYALRRGEIYEFDFGLNVNAEFSSRHYGLVLTDSNENDPLVLVCPLKTDHNGKGGNKHSDINLGIVPGLNTDHCTLAVFNQIRNIDKVRLYTKGAIGNSEYVKGANHALADVDLKVDETKIIKVKQEIVNMICEAYFNYVKLGDKIDENEY